MNLKWIIGVLLAVLLFWSGGCVTRLKDNGEIGFRMGYDVAFYSKTSKTDAESEAEIKSQPLLDYLATKKADDKPKEPTP